MNKYIIKIKNIEIFKDFIKIISYNNIIFISKIIKGNVNFKIYNNTILYKKNNLNTGKIRYKYQEIGLYNLEVDDIITIYEINNLYKKNINYILIKKIKIKNKYIITSDSSNEDIYY